jgi:putative molybdopterin biosynthesis protein
MPQNKALSTAEVADILHVSKSTIYDLIRKGEINSYKIGRKVRFTQDDVDAYIARSRHEQSTQPVRQVFVQSSLLCGEPDTAPNFIISGQDVVLDILSNYLRHYGVVALRAYVGSFESILSLYQGKVQVATAHLWDSDTDEYNRAYVRRLMPGVPAVLVNISYRMQGFYVKKGNPKNIRGWEDLGREDIRLINRRKGSGSRILLDEHLYRLGVPGSAVKGYDSELNSHLTVAAAVANGEADFGLGTERVSRQMDGLEFVPLQKERYDFVIKKETISDPQIQAMLKVIGSPEYFHEISQFSGNDFRDLGKIVAEV